MSTSKTWTDQDEKDTTTGAKVTGDQFVSFTGAATGGQVWVEYSLNDSDYFEVPGSRRNTDNIPDAFELSVPDLDVYYRLACQRIVGTVNCYMGP